MAVKRLIGLVGEPALDEERQQQHDTELKLMRSIRSYRCGDVWVCVLLLL